MEKLTLICLYLVPKIAMEFCEYGSLADVMKMRSKAFNESQVAYIMRRTLQALDYMAANKKVHRDIKPANIMLCGNGKVKLGDLGITKELKPDGTLRDRIGSVLYLAPEIARDTAYNCKVDIWSLGISAVELLIGRAPRSNDRTREILRQLVTEPQGPSLQQLPRHFSPLLRNFLARCLQVDQNKRPTAAELLNDPFILRASSASLKPIVDEMRSLVSFAGSFQAALSVSSNCRIEHATAEPVTLGNEEEDDEHLLLQQRLRNGEDYIASIRASGDLLMESSAGGLHANAEILSGLPHLHPLAGHQIVPFSKPLKSINMQQPSGAMPVAPGVHDRVLILPPPFAAPLESPPSSSFAYLSGEEDGTACSFESEEEIHARVLRPILDSPVWARPDNNVLQASGFVLNAPVASNIVSAAAQ